MTAPKQENTVPPPPGDIPGVVGWNIRRIRLGQGLTQEELAERAGTSSDTIKRYESGTYEGIRLVMVYHIAEALGVSLDALVPPPANRSPEQLLEEAEALIRRKRTLQNEIKRLGAQICTVRWQICASLVLWGLV